MGSKTFKKLITMSKNSNGALSGNVKIADTFKSNILTKQATKVERATPPDAILANTQTSGMTKGPAASETE
jgi:hypothetical protein